MSVGNGTSSPSRRNKAFKIVPAQAGGGALVDRRTARSPPHATTARDRSCRAFEAYQSSFMYVSHYSARVVGSEDVHHTLENTRKKRGRAHLISASSSSGVMCGLPCRSSADTSALRSSTAA